MFKTQSHSGAWFRVEWYCQNFFWLVYLLFGALVLGFALSTVKSAAGLALLLCLPFPLSIVLSLVGLFVTTRELRIQLLMGLLGFLLFSSVCFYFSETILRQRLPPDKFQFQLQGIYGRRDSSGERTDHGYSQIVSYDHFGWRDREHTFAKPESRKWVFIGDSYLDAQIAPTLASTFEGLVKAQDSKAEVINLGKDGTAPDPDYRHRFFEWAFEYQPTDIAVFLFAGNDYRYYEHAPYQHPKFFLTEESVERVRNNPRIKRFAETFESLAKAKTVLKNRQEFFEKIGPAEPEVQQQAYQVALAFGSLVKPGWLPNTREYLERAIIPRLQRLAVEGTSQVAGLVGMLEAYAGPYQSLCGADEEQILSAYRGIFDKPKKLRLNEMAYWAAAVDCRLDRHEVYRTVLNSFPARFRNEWLEDPLSRGPWLQGVQRAVDLRLTGELSNQKIYRIDPHQEGQFEKLVSEMSQFAQKKNVRFHVVLIPEAYDADPSYHAFWEPVYQYWRVIGDSGQIHRALAERLPLQGIHVVNLADYPKTLDGAYTWFNGHWGVRGVEQIASLLKEKLSP